MKITTDRSLQQQRRIDRTRSGQPAYRRHDHDVPRAGTYRKPAGVGTTSSAAVFISGDAHTPKPTHMIGGYAQQLAYGFNYYGTVGSNRDEFVVRTFEEH
ncbi:hypothetical protein KCP69_16975 [Salmonella enterica subsp. enterica]|nr:hypothetical protein KCP69_16975 [Salmonella enterica subsp. enterica]